MQSLWSKGMLWGSKANADVRKFSSATAYFWCVHDWSVEAIKGLSSINFSAQIRKDTLSGR